MAKVIWTAFAIEDLKSIHEYISKDSKVYADKFVEKIIDRVDQLETSQIRGESFLNLPLSQ